MSGEMRSSNSFVLRIWWEEEGWRGWVQHAASGETRYFEQVEDLISFVEVHTGLLAQIPDLHSMEREA